MNDASTRSIELTDDVSRSALRASDAEREHTALLLRDHCAEGRLSPSG